MCRKEVYFFWYRLFFGADLTVFFFGAAFFALLFPALVTVFFLVAAFSLTAIEGRLLYLPLLTYEVFGTVLSVTTRCF